MTAETAGELLTGLSQEVFDRSVFLKQTDLAVSQSQELEKKITALVSTGEEDISFTEANDCLKAWLHRRRFHKTGQIPQLEAREEALRQSLDQTTALRQELDQLRTRANSLRRQRDQWGEPPLQGAGRGPEPEPKAPRRGRRRAWTPPKRSCKNSRPSRPTRSSRPTPKPATWPRTSRLPRTIWPAGDA